jgi:hypothetical protein
MSAPVPPPDTDRPTFAAGPVTGARADAPAPPWPEPDVISSGRPRLGRRALFWYGGAAGLILVTGLIVVLVMLLYGHRGSNPASPNAEAGPDTRPPLARLCPAPSAPNVAPSAAAQPAPTGPRTVDEKAGISYAAYGAPWEPWPLLWAMGTLEIPYGVGQHFVTETYRGGEYHASILSAAVPATVNDSTVIDLECTGRQVAADVRASYYPQPNEMDLIRDERTTLGGRPAWVTKFRLQFHEEGLEATSELAAVALIDVGRPTAAVLYVSIPSTHPQWEYVVDQALASVRPT